MAGSCYARDIREAPRHVASLRAEYRQLSQSWHMCLDFEVPLPPRDKLVESTRKPADTTKTQEQMREHVRGHKRTRKELKEELNQ